MTIFHLLKQVLRMVEIDRQNALASLAAIVAILAIGRVFRKWNEKPVVSEYERHNLPVTPQLRTLALGSGEYQYARLGLEQQGAYRIYLIATVTGKRVSAEKLAFAAECIQRRHPMLRCRLVKVNGTIALQEDPDLKLQTRIRPRIDAETCRETFHKEAAKDTVQVGEEAPSPHKLWLFQSEKPDPSEIEQSEIVLDLSHFAVDGSGLSPLMHEVLYYVLDPEAKLPEYGNWPVSQDFGLREVLATKMNALQRVFLKVFGFMRLIYYVTTREDISLADPHDTIPVKNLGKLNDTICLCQKFNESETEAFIARCKEHKVSVTAAATAVYLETAAELKYQELKRKFSIYASLVADSRKFATPATPATDLAPHVYVLPPFWTQEVEWVEKDDTSRTWTMAGEVKEFLRNYLSQPKEPIAYADMIGFFLSLQPAKPNSPVVNVSSWSAQSPVQKEYAGTRVEGVELFQNMACTSHVNLSLYTFVNKLNMSIFVATPRFRKDVIEELNRKVGEKLRRMIAGN